MKDQPVSYAYNPAVMRRAHDFYAIYMASCDGKNYQGLPCPAWQGLTPAVRRHWYTVALRSFEPAVAGTAVSRGPSRYSLDHLANYAAAWELWREYSQGESVIEGGP